MRRGGLWLWGPPFRPLFSPTPSRRDGRPPFEMTPEEAAERMAVFQLVDEMEVANGGCTPRENQFALRGARGLGEGGIGAADRPSTPGAGRCPGGRGAGGRTGGSRAVITDYPALGAKITHVGDGQRTPAAVFWRQRRVDRRETMADQNVPDLTPREAELMELVARGYTNKEIAERVFLSPHTVKAHLKQAFRKCGVRNRVGGAGGGARRGAQ